MANKIKLEVVHLRTSSMVRPANMCGTCGWSLKAWTIAQIDKRKRYDPIGAFIAVNPNWVRNEVELS